MGKKKPHDATECKRVAAQDPSKRTTTTAEDEEEEEDDDIPRLLTVYYPRLLQVSRIEREGEEKRE